MSKEIEARAIIATCIERIKQALQRRIFMNIHNLHNLFTDAELGRYMYYRGGHGRIYSFFMAKICLNKVYMKHLEIPLTTYCTLRCRHCANLMQYYSNPSHSSAEQVIGSLKEILSSVDGIVLLRILGGEPLLYPELYRVLHFCLREQKINRIEVVTNGTLLLPEDVLTLLSGHVKAKPEMKLCISDYGKNSSKKDLLIRQLDEAGIPYTVQLSKWRAAGNILRRDRNRKELKNLFRGCNKCISLLNGELHICPRSSHGTDLHFVPKKQGEYIIISEYKGDPIALQVAICALLRRQYVEACKYCDGDEDNGSRNIAAGEQCSRAECLAYFHEARRQNQASETENRIEQCRIEREKNAL